MIGRNCFFQVIRKIHGRHQIVIGIIPITYDELLNSAATHLLHINTLGVAELWLYPQQAMLKSTGSHLI